MFPPLVVVLCGTLPLKRTIHVVSCRNVWQIIFSQFWLVYVEDVESGQTPLSNGDTIVAELAAHLVLNNFILQILNTFHGYTCTCTSNCQLPIM